MRPGSRLGSARRPYRSRARIEMSACAKWIGWRSLGVLAALVGVATAASCTLLVSSNEVQCTRSEDCWARGGAFAGATCVAHACVPMEAGASADGGVDAYAGADTADPSDPWGCLDQAPQPSDPKISVDLEFVAFDPYQTYHTASALYG